MEYRAGRDITSSVSDKSFFSSLNVIDPMMCITRSPHARPTTWTEPQAPLSAHNGRQILRDRPSARRPRGAQGACRGLNA